MYVFINPFARTGCDTRSIFKQGLTDLNSEFFFSYTDYLTKPKETSLPYYLSIAEGRIIRFIPFLMLFAQCEMQLATSRIWTRVTVSISYDDNHNTTSTSKMYVYVHVLFFTVHLYVLFLESMCMYYFLVYSCTYYFYSVCICIIF